MNDTNTGAPDNNGNANGSREPNPNQWHNEWNNQPQQYPHSGQPQPGQHAPAPQTDQPYPGQPHQQQPYPGQHYQQQPYPGQHYPAPQTNQPAATPPATEPKKKTPLLKIGALLAALVLAIAGGIYVVTQTGIGQKLAEMSYIASADPGPEAFMDTVVNDDSADIVQSANIPEGRLAGGVEGSSDNLYGGTGELSTCDAAALLNHLNANDELNTAFAEGIGINADDVERYVNALSPLVLMQDTWVTNHGFNNGHANPFQAVLQRGTAVLVDAKGVPRVRCACGNPLAEAWNGYTAPSPNNTAWDGYTPGNVVAVYDAGESQKQLKIRDLETGSAEDYAISDDKIDAQTKVTDAVTDDTPKTVPSDMDVKPDEQLLNTLGMKPADNGDTRPTGSERFQTGNGSFDPQAEAKPEFTPIDPSEFNSPANTHGQHYIHVGPKSSDGTYAILCTFNIQYGSIGCQSGLMPRDLLFGYGQSVGAETVPTAYYSVAGNNKAGYFEASAPMDFVSGINRAEIRELKPGESVEFAGIVCEATDSDLTCRNDKSSARWVFDDAVYFNDSKTPFGQRCADGVRTLQGGISCEEAERIHEVYMEDDGENYGNRRIRRVEGYSCGLFSLGLAESVNYAGSCTQESEPHQSFIIGAE